MPLSSLFSWLYAIGYLKKEKDQLTNDWREKRTNENRSSCRIIAIAAGFRKYIATCFRGYTTFQFVHFSQSKHAFLLSFGSVRRVFCFGARESVITSIVCSFAHSHVLPVVPSCCLQPATPSASFANSYYSLCLFSVLILLPGASFVSLHS